MIAKRFHALMVTAVNTRAAYDSASKLARAASSTSLGTCPSAILVIDSVEDEHHGHREDCGREFEPTVQRQVGLMKHRARVAAWALDGALAEAGDDPTPSMETVAAVMAAKREIAHAFNAETTLIHGGRLALGLPADQF